MDLSSLKLESIELKFLLRLLGNIPDYRTRISKIEVGNTSKRNKACESLCAKGLIGYANEVQRYRIEPPGKSLLNSDPEQLSITLSPHKLELLQKAAQAKSYTTPSQAKKVPAEDRHRLLYELDAQGLIQITKDQIKDVWLTQDGIRYLLHDYMPTQPRADLKFALLGNYLSFLRQFLGKSEIAEIFPKNQSGLTEKQYLAPSQIIANVSDISPESVLETIRILDQQLDTDNFLPIFHLREKLQPPLDRNGLDKILFELQSQDLIEFSTLQDVIEYSEEQAAAGISQPIGGALFYISVIE